jgi:hypothetical protein
MDFGQDFFDALPTVPGTFRRAPHEFALDIFIQESDKVFKTSRRDQLIGSDASGVVMKDVRLRRGGTIETADATFRIDNILDSSIPGLSDLQLERIAGVAVPVADAGGNVPMDDELQILRGSEWETVPANIMPSVEIEEIGRDGNRVIVSRTMIAVSVEDAVGVSGGAAIMLNGKRKTVTQSLADGLGFVKLLV